MKLFNKILFWDVKIEDLDEQQHADFIIARVLEEGNSTAIKKVTQQYSSEQIKRVVCKSRRISTKTANFWKLRLGISEPILCLSEAFTQTQKKLWTN